MKRSALLRRKPLRPVSVRRSRESSTYAKLRRDYLDANPYCELWLLEHGIDPAKPYAVAAGILMGCPRATDIHHTRQRGRFYLDVSTWMAVSRSAHERIHGNPAWARERGYLF